MSKHQKNCCYVCVRRHYLHTDTSNYENRNGWSDNIKIVKTNDISAFIINIFRWHAKLLSSFTIIWLSKNSTLSTPRILCTVLGGNKVLQTITALFWNGNTKRYFTNKEFFRACVVESSMTTYQPGSLLAAKGEDVVGLVPLTEGGGVHHEDGILH